MMSMLTLTLLAADLAAFVPLEGVIVPQGCSLFAGLHGAQLHQCSSVGPSGVEGAGLPAPCCGQTLQVETRDTLHKHQFDSIPLLPSFSLHILRCDELHRIIET